MKVSVCLAAYNGERYIAEQLRSILAQLSPQDELIVCDDGSRDRTREVVAGIGDPRVTLRTFTHNVGHVRNFERAIAAATGDLIFLSDQDDEWRADKVREVKRCFQENPRLQLVHHALSTMDAEGRTLSPLWNPLREGPQGRAGFLLRQLVRCQVFGCGAAFRRELLDVLLPFPASAYAHDHWLTVAAGVGGSVHFLNLPLVRYRLHGANVTPRQGLGWRGRLRVRWLFLDMIAVAIARRLRRPAPQRVAAP
ncbi:glycosyltransferase family 2 protein [Piscinibacter sp. XHJ-5]|uniref:glycosyltransferase family 2 protein n=1 Tax=Piscinibacter sp. XHJ-5 TaxID=3037797 RepID=UPI002452D9AE|nr:glycosyltransferase family 2 protein [Piscinibacter sp. XHJ-5]